MIGKEMVVVMITDMETMLMDNSDRIWGYHVYRRMFTPYEQQRGFVDESCYEDEGNIRYGKIVEAIDIGNGEWLLGIRECWDEGKEELEYSDFITYYALSELRLMTKVED